MRLVSNLRECGSGGEHVIFLVDPVGKICLISWQSMRIRRGVKSTLAAEMHALLGAAEEGIYMSYYFRNTCRWNKYLN